MNNDIETQGWSYGKMIQDNTRRILFAPPSPSSFDCESYAFSFDFCNDSEKYHLYTTLKCAWAWGRPPKARKREESDV